MSSYVISCCSTADLSEAHLSKRDIKYVCFHYMLDGQWHLDDLGKSMSLDEFYKKVGDGAETKTSQVNADEYVEFFTPFLQQGKDILHVTLSTGISGTFNSASIARDLLAEDFPDRKIYIVDSLGASSGYGMLVDTLADLRDSGATIEEARDFAEINRLKLNHWFFSTDLKFYVRGGRISKAAGMVGSMLGICPLLNMDSTGHLVLCEKVRSKKKVIKTLVERMAECVQDGVNYAGKCFISHSGCLEDAQTVAEAVKEVFGKLKDKIEIFNIGTTIGSHTGPGTVALFFWGSSR